MYVKTNIAIKNYMVIEHEINAISVEISNLKGLNNLRVVGMYRPPPRANYGAMVSALDSLLFDKRLKNTVVCGDFNINVSPNVNCEASALCADYLNFVAESGLELCNNNVTRPASGTIIDHVLSNMTYSFRHKVDTVINSFSDHNIMIAKIECNTGGTNTTEVIE